MKLLSYRRDDAVRYGYLDHDRVCELGDGDLTPVLGSLAPDQPWQPPDPRGEYRPDEIDVLAPIPRPGKVLAVAANYQDHVAEGGGEPLQKDSLAPRLFLKPPTCVAASGAEIALPDISTQVDWEAELVVVLGRPGRNVPTDAALDLVAGYSVGNDISARSVDYGYQRTTDAAVRYFDWLAGKWPDGFSPYGPYLTSADAVPDPQDLPVSLEVNGVRFQDGNTKDMIFTVAELVAFASRLMTLEPGDILLTGTPAGVGAATGDFLTTGDQMTVRIGELGELVNRVV